ncbi:MAG: hypothetical protein V7709_01945 [Halioglobus sp.]
MSILIRIGLLCLCSLAQAQPTSEPENGEIRAWREFSRQLEVAGVEVLKRYPQPTDIDRAEGLRYLLQQLGSSIEKRLIEQTGHLPLLREYFSDWQMERPGTYYLERVDPWPAPKPVTTEQMSDLLTDTVTSFSSRAPQWQGRVEMSQKHLQNKVHMQKSDDQGLSSNYYGNVWWESLGYIAEH